MLVAEHGESLLLVGEHVEALLEVGRLARAPALELFEIGHALCSFGKCRRREYEVDVGHGLPVFAGFAERAFGIFAQAGHIVFGPGYCVGQGSGTSVDRVDKGLQRHDFVALGLNLPVERRQGIELTLGALFVAADVFGGLLYLLIGAFPLRLDTFARAGRGRFFLFRSCGFLLGAHRLLFMLRTGGIGTNGHGQT